MTDGLPEPESKFKADVHIREVATGTVRVYESEEYVWEDGWSDYLWRDGNYRCDCNRALFFARAIGEEDPPEHACTEDRYRIDKLVRRDTGEVMYQEAA